MKKYIALLLCFVSIFSVFAGCGKQESNEIVLPVQNVADTVENRQQAMLEIAKAYFHKNPYVQYDEEPLTPLSRRLGVRNASNMNNTPEMAGPQRSIYHVCSFFTYICTFHTFDFKILGAWEDSWITPVATAEDETIAPYVIWTRTNSATPEENLQAMEEFRSILQPGDLIYYNRYRANTSHAVMWVGDLDGDGDNDMLNADGKYYSTETAEEFREADGGIDLNTDNWDCPSADQFFFDPTAYDYFPRLKDVGIVRFSDKADVLPLTERAKTRVLYPDLSVFYEVEGGIYGAVAKGDTVTYTLRVLNGSQQNYEGLLIQLPVPEHGEIVAVNGEKAKNNLLKLTANVAAGDELTVTYTVKAVGEVGSVLKTGTGYVHAIPLPNLNTVITSANPDPAAVKAALDASKTGDAFLAAYLDAMGYAVSIPSGEEICKALCERKSFGDYKLYWPRETAEIAQEHETLAKMQIPDFFGGQSVATTSDHLRVKELRAQDLQAGDVLLWCDARGAETTVAIHDGENLLLPQNGQLVPMSQEDLDAFIMHYYFIALRPTQAL